MRLEIIRKVGCWVAICLFLTFMVRSSCFGKVIWTTPKFRTFTRTSIKVWSFSCIDVVLTTTESCRQATAFFIRSMRWMNEVFAASPNRVFTGSGLFAAFILWAASPRNTVRTATVFLNQWRKIVKKREHIRFRNLRLLRNQQRLECHRQDSLQNWVHVLHFLDLYNNRILFFRRHHTSKSAVKIEFYKYIRKYNKPETAKDRE